VARRSAIDTAGHQGAQSFDQGRADSRRGGRLSQVLRRLAHCAGISPTLAVPVKVIAAFDPYYHYVAFNRIASVLSEEAGKVFKFKEQEKLHEEIIDSGLAKIYDGHLAVARSIAKISALK